MATFTGTSRPSRGARLRLELVGAEVAAISAFLTMAGVIDLPAVLLLILVVGALAIQSVLFYQLGRVREKLDMPYRR